MIVFISGMPRSGSTFSFNIVREILSARGVIYQEASSDLCQVLDNSKRSDHIIQKAHTACDRTTKLIQVGAIKSICTVRKPEAAIASCMEVFDLPVEEAIHHMQAWLNMYAKISEYSLIVPYEMINFKPAHAAWMIANYICPDVEVQEIRNITRKFSKKKVKEIASMKKDDEGVVDLGFSYYDRETFFHRRHVSDKHDSNAIDRIGLDAVTTIRNHLKPWIDDGVLNYSCDKFT